MKIVRILGKVLLVLLVVFASAIALVYWRSTSLLAQRIDVKEPALAMSGDADARARGEHLAITRGCIDCHGADLGGRVLIEAFPIGRISGPNLTSGAGGIGGRLDVTATERAIRHGLGEGGRLLLYMPSTDFSGLSDADTADLIAYVKSVPAVDRDVPPPLAGPLMRALFLFGKAPLVCALQIDHHAAHMNAMAAAATPEYGRYLAQSCTGCHTAKFTGGHVPGTPPNFPNARNITQDPANGIGKWTKVDFYTALRNGKRPDGTDINPFMPWKAFARFSDAELDALWAYLQTLPTGSGGR